MYNGLKDYHKTMCDIDPTFVWYKGKQMNPFELDALTSPEKWPTMLMKMKEFAHDIQPKPAGGMCYFVGRIGFDGNVETFKEDAKGAAELINGVCYPNMLQVLEVVENDIIMNLYPGMNAPWWMEEWKCQMNEMARCDGKMVRFNFALVNKPIYLGKGSTDFSKIRDPEKKKKQMIVQCSLHANFPKDQAVIGKWYLAQAVKSECTKQLSRVNFHMIPKYSEYSNKIGEQTHIRHALNQHMQLRASVSKTINHNLVDLGREVPGMNGATP